MTIIKKVKENSQLYPIRVALASSDGQITYSELWNLVSRFASYIKENTNNNSDKQEYVLIKGYQNVAYVVAVLSVLLSGNIVVPFEKNISNQKYNELKDILKPGMIISDEYYEKFNLDVLREKIKNIHEQNHEIPKEDAISDLLFTTGTTGESEGIFHTNRSHYATIENVLNRINMKEHNKTLIIAPLSHSFALRRLYANLVYGSTIGIIDNLFPFSNVYKAIDDFDLNSIVMVPTTMSFLLEKTYDELNKHKDRLTYVEFTGSPLSLNLIDSIKNCLPNTSIYNMYGCTEAGIILGSDITKNRYKISSIGQPNINSQVDILDENYHVINGYGKENSGYLSVKGPILLHSYFNKEMNNIHNGYLVTQDIVYKDQDNYFYFIGRDSDIINVGAYKISPIEVETILNKFDGIEECIYSAKENASLGSLPILYVIKNEKYNENDFYAYMNDNLDSYKMPKEIIFIDKIEKTYNGKINRKKYR